MMAVGSSAPFSHAPNSVTRAMVLVMLALVSAAVALFLFFGSRLTPYEHLDNQPVGHVVVSTHWNGFAHVDELAVIAGARRHGVARSLLEVVRFWSHKKNLPGIMLETQNNNLGACRLYERCGYQVGGIDDLRYRGIDPQTSEVAIFWYLIFESRIQPV